MQHTKWLVAVDDSTFSHFAFNYTLAAMKTGDHLFLMHVAEEPARVFVGYATAQLLDSLKQVEDLKARKILVHYGHKAKEAGVHFTMMKGTDNNPGVILCKAVGTYKIDNLVLGRRSLGGVERLFSGSTSKYVVENADCTVIVVKTPFGAPAEHDSKAEVIQAEEHERLRRLGEEAPAEIHDVSLDAIKKAEENERDRRIREEAACGGLNDVITHYKFHDEILALNKDKPQETK